MSWRDQSPQPSEHFCRRHPCLGRFAIYGSYSDTRDGIIDLAPTESWGAVNQAVREGYRGLPGGSTLPQLLQKHRGKRNSACLPKLSQTVILGWADEHYQRTGNWPVAESGDVQAAPGENWASVDFALKRGRRGLPGGASLASLLIQHRGKRDKFNDPISTETISEWMRSHASRHGKYPSCHTGTVEDAPEENWGSLQTALSAGYRGLPGGSTLAKLKQCLIQEGKLLSLGERAPYSLETITAWINAYTIHHGTHPTASSGIIVEAPEENWKKVDNALRMGSRGLPGGSSLAKLKQELIREGKLPDLS